jgi:hypothetical protein
MRYRTIIALAVVYLVAACSGDSTGIENRTEGDLTFARFDASAQAHATSSSFWAVKGQDRRLELRYPASPGQSEGDQFLEFRVRPGSLLLRPNGTPFLNGDSVLITVQADPNQRFIFTFEPSGLTFSPADPAELRIRYDRASRDVDNDGDQDAADVQLLNQLKVWQQAAPGLPWLLVPSLRVENESEVRGTVTHFTSFALAS